MRILIDMQAFQGASHARGVGRYCVDVTRGIINNRGENDIHLLLNGALSEHIGNIRKNFEEELGKNNIHVWYPFIPLAQKHNPPEVNKFLSSLIYQQFILSIVPDIFFVPSIFEGWHDDAICAVNLLRNKVFLACTVYDFIPKNSDSCNYREEEYQWYEYQYQQLNNFDLFLPISDFVKTDCNKYFINTTSVPVMAGFNNIFRCIDIHDNEATGYLKELGINKKFILTIGTIEERKNKLSLIKAFLSLPEYIYNEYQLVITYQPQEQPIVNSYREYIKKHAAKNKADIIFLTSVDDEILCKLYNLCSLFVFPSLEEGFGLPILEAMQCGAPTICSDTTSMPEIMAWPEACFNPRDIASIAAKILQALTDENFRKELVRRGKLRSHEFSWDITAKKILTAFDANYKKNELKAIQPESDEQRILKITEACGNHPEEKINLAGLAKTLAKTFNADCSPQFLVDIGIIAKFDAKAGIQRVIRSISQQLINNPPKGYKVRFVRPDLERGRYVYAHSAALRIFSYDDGCEDDLPVDVNPQDIFLGLDLSLYEVLALQNWFFSGQEKGASFYFIVYDIIPLLYPHYCTEGICRPFAEWLRTIAAFDGLICISKAVADDVCKWFHENTGPESRPKKVSWFHLGADIEKSHPTFGLPGDASEIIDCIGSKPSFLVVSTIEPRKGHRQTLAAFERLWKDGYDINLVFVGHPGWFMDDFEALIDSHPEKGKRFFRLNDISDEYLEKVYAASACVIMPSEAEGFGLAIIEGAMHKKPLILRDIPVFREIADDNAFYFSGLDAESLSQKISEWLEIYKKGKHPASDDLKWLTWNESYKMLVSHIIQ